MVEPVLRLFENIGHIVWLSSILYPAVAIWFLYSAMRNERRRFIYAGVAMFFAIAVSASYAAELPDPRWLWIMRGALRSIAAWIVLAIFYHENIRGRINGKSTQ